MPDRENKGLKGTSAKDGAKEIHIDEELKAEQEVEIRHLKTKPVPAIIVLLAGFIAAAYSYVQGVKGLDWLLIVFVTIIVFLIIGDIARFLLDRIEIRIEPEEAVPESGDETGEEAEDEDEGEDDLT